MDLKDIIAQNIIDLRKQNRWTQAELADKLNYSDKAISKWERGESIPEVSTLKQIADIFGCTVDLLLTENGSSEIKKYAKPRNITINRYLISAIATLVVWIMAIVIFSYSYIYYPERIVWEAFVWAVPVSFLVLFILVCKWKIRKPKIYISSAFLWSFLIATYISTIQYKTWLVFIVGIPIQILFVLIYCLK